MPFLFLFCICFKVGWVVPDGIGYTSYLASLFLDGDLHLLNQYRITGIIGEQNIYGAIVTPSGYIFSFWTIGTSLLLMFFWLLGHALTYVSTALGQNWAAHGFSLYYNLGVRFSTALMGLCALTMMNFWIKRYTNQKAALWAVIFLLLGSPYWWYMFQYGDVSHVPSSFAICLFLVLWDIYRRNPEKLAAFTVGVAGGLVTIIKPNNVVIFLFPILTWITQFKTRGIKNQYVAWTVAGAIFSGFLQLWVWHILFGNPLGAILERGVSYHYKFFTGHFRIFDVLFSSYHGLFFFSPVLVFSFWGLGKLFKIDRVLAGVSASILVFEICLMASERYFWEGGAFGLRRVVDWTPLFGLGIAGTFRDRKPIPFAFAILATIWTILLTATYSRLPGSVLNEYQPPSLILDWVSETIIGAPGRLISLLRPPLPLSLLLPALVIFAIPGYLLLNLLLRINRPTVETSNATPDKTSLRILTAILIAIFLTGYALVGRASINYEKPKKRYAKEIQNLLKQQNRAKSIEEVELLLLEGMYLGRSKSWESAAISFAEAIRFSPSPAQTRVRIGNLIRPYMTDREVERYLEKISQR